MSASEKDETKEMIRETVKQLFAEMAPILQSIALTPEKLREAQKPYIDPDVLARENHEQEEWRKQEQEQRANTEARQAACSHKDKNQRWSIALQHNFHDNMPRGVCARCRIHIYPAHWDYRPITDPTTGKITNQSFIVQEHPLYRIVREIESQPA